MAMLYEFLPLILFLIALVVKDIYFAAIVLMVAMPIGLAMKYFRTGKLDRMYFWSTVLAVVFSSATLYFRDPKFLFWKPTVFYWALAIASLASQWIGDKPLVQRFFGMLPDINTSQLTRSHWTQLNVIWVLFFVGVGLVNIYVAYNYSIAVWGTVKVFGLFGLSMVFIIGQTVWIVSKLGDDAFPRKDGEQE